MKKLKSVYIFPNGMVVVFALDGKQVSEFQGEFNDVMFDEIRKNSDGETRFFGLNYLKKTNMKNYTFDEAAKVLQAFYPQMTSLYLVDDKKSFVFTAIVKGQLFFDGKYFKSVGFTPGRKDILLEITNENISELDFQLKTHS